MGKENLVWAPNISPQHGPERLLHVVNKIKEVDKFGGTYEKMIEALETLGKEAAKLKKMN